MKKEYIKPSVETYKLDLSNQFLAGSGPDEIDLPGTGTTNGEGFIGLSKDYKGLDVWDEFED